MKQKRIKVYMTTEELNGYRLTSLEEPTDEMLEAMYQVGRRLPAELRETALGGCAATPSACARCGGCG